MRVGGLRQIDDLGVCLRDGLFGEVVVLEGRGRQRVHVLPQEGYVLSRHQLLLRDVRISLLSLFSHVRLKYNY